MSNIVIPIIIFIILVYSFFKGNNIYEDFLSGVKEGIKIVYNIIPTIVAMTFAINMFLKSNVINILLIPFKSVVSFIPIEIIPMALLRPISGSATLVILSNILNTYGADSFIGRLASTMQGCTDTTIYVLALYFSSVKITKSRYALLVGLLADLAGIIASIIVVSLVFK